MGCKVIQGDALEVLRTLESGTVQTCITSPPYYGLRDYGTADWQGGDAGCDHQGKPMATRANVNRNTGTGQDKKNTDVREFYREVCGKCGAKRVDRQVGLEQTPDEYVAKLVTVFAEVRRVLRDDGTLWLNLGDSYAGSGKGPAGNLGANTAGGEARHLEEKTGGQVPPGLKPKDLIGIPWRVALALQADGWYLRQDLIWHKPNPMPESVTDRCTKAHEYIFLFAKDCTRAHLWVHSERGYKGRVYEEPAPDYVYVNQQTGERTRQEPGGWREARFVQGGKEHKLWGRVNLWSGMDYYYDLDAIREEYAEASLPRALRGTSDANKWADGAPGSTAHTMSKGRKNIRKEFESSQGGGGSGFKGHSGYRAADGRLLINPLGRNRRSVWIVPTVSYREAHFATYPPDLIEPMILAGAPVGGVVLDPFNGSGTTGAVAMSLGREYIGIDLNPKYIDLTRKRLSKVNLPLIPKGSE